MRTSMQTKGPFAPVAHRLAAAAGLLVFAPILLLRLVALSILGRRVGSGLDRLLRRSGLDAMAALAEVASGRRRWEGWRARAAVQFLYSPVRPTSPNWANGRGSGDKPS